MTAAGSSPDASEQYAAALDAVLDLERLLDRLTNATALIMEAAGSATCSHALPQ
jgi:hypothetical protein